MCCSMQVVDEHQHLVFYSMTLPVSVFLLSLSKTTTTPLNISCHSQSIMDACQGTHHNCSALKSFMQVFSAVFGDERGESNWWTFPSPLDLCSRTTCTSGYLADRSCGSSCVSCQCLEDTLIVSRKMQKTVRKL